MRVRGHLVDHVGGGTTRLSLSEPASVRTLRELLDLPPGPYIWVINGAAATDGALLSPGDRVEVHPPAAGG